MTEAGEIPAVSRFREYLRCNTMHPNPDYTEAVAFLKRQAEEIGLKFEVLNPAGDPVVILTLPGSDLSKKSVLLNSHMDVVPVFPEHWTYPPFSAHKTADGKIYARGSQDMKCVGMQHLEAVRSFKAEGKELPRTLHLSFVPDEEVGGKKGVRALIENKCLDPYNIGFIMDEGLASGVENNVLPVFYAERNIWQFEVTCPGDPGHGSRFIENTAAEKFRRIVNSFLSFRDEQEAKLKADPKIGLGGVTTLNLTIVQGGVQFNVVPDKMVASFDVRITPTQDLKELESQFRGWIAEAGEGVSMSFYQQCSDQTMTDISASSKWFAALSSALEAEKVSFKPEIFPAATDSRHLREAGYEALGFSYMPNTPILLHDHNEYLDEKTYLDGIRVFTRLIENLANVS